MEGFGANGEVAQLYSLQEAGGNVQLLELLIGIPSKFICTQFSTLLGKCIQGVSDNGMKENTGRRNTWQL